MSQWEDQVRTETDDTTTASTIHTADRCSLRKSPSFLRGGVARAARRAGGGASPGYGMVQRCRGVATAGGSPPPPSDPIGTEHLGVPMHNRALKEGGGGRL